MPTISQKRKHGRLLLCSEEWQIKKQHLNSSGPDFVCIRVNYFYFRAVRSWRLTGIHMPLWHVWSNTQRDLQPISTKRQGITSSLMVIIHQYVLSTQIVSVQRHADNVQKSCNIGKLGWIHRKITKTKDLKRGLAKRPHTSTFMFNFLIWNKPSYVTIMQAT